MTDFSEVSKNLVDRGYDVKSFSSGAEAADYLNGEIDGKTVGIGGSATVESIGLFEALDSHNDVIWHWKQDADQARKKAMTAEIYISSANALANHQYRRRGKQGFFFIVRTRKNIFRHRKK